MGGIIPGSLFFPLAGTESRPNRCTNSRKCEHLFDERDGAKARRGLIDSDAGILTLISKHRAVEGGAERTPYIKSPGTENANRGKASQGDEGHGFSEDIFACKTCI